MFNTTRSRIYRLILITAVTLFAALAVSHLIASSAHAECAPAASTECTPPPPTPNPEWSEDPNWDNTTGEGEDPCFGSDAPECAIEVEWCPTETPAEQTTPEVETTPEPTQATTPEPAPATTTPEVITETDAQVTPEPAQPGTPPTPAPALTPAPEVITETGEQVPMPKPEAPATTDEQPRRDSSTRDDRPRNVEIVVVTQQDAPAVPAANVPQADVPQSDVPQSDIPMPRSLPRTSGEIDENEALLIMYGPLAAVVLMLVGGFVTFRSFRARWGS